MRVQLSTLTRALAVLGREFHSRGWALGTSGNFSVVVSREPFRMLITPTGVDKGGLTPDRVVLVDSAGNVVKGSRQASAEAPVHLAIVKARQASAVLHTHSIWSTILSEEFAGRGGLAIEGYEMLKGFEGVKTHEHREWLPIIENSQDVGKLVASFEAMLRRFPDAHGLLLRRHGLYAWGENLSQAKRHLEVLEFLLEAIGRERAPSGAAD